jgi:hypothetical protein
MKKPKFEKRFAQEESQPENRDRTRDRHGVKAQRANARKAKGTRREFENGKGWKA